MPTGRIVQLKEVADREQQSFDEHLRQVLEASSNRGAPELEESSVLRKTANLEALSPNPSQAHSNLL